MYAKPPAHLSPTTRRWWSEVVSDFALDAHDLRMLQSACEAWDRMQKAYGAIQKYGRTVADGARGRKDNPAIEVVRECHAVFLEAVEQLEITVDPSMIPPPIPKRR